MLRPSWFMFIMSCVGLVIFAYYRVLKKNRPERYSSVNKYLLYFLFTVSSLIFAWGIIAMAVK